MNEQEIVYDVQSWNVAFDFGNPCVLHVNVYREGETMLTYDEIRDEAVGYAEEIGIEITEDTDTQIRAIQLEPMPTTKLNTQFEEEK